MEYNFNKFLEKIEIIPGHFDGNYENLRHRLFDEFGKKFLKNKEFNIYISTIVKHIELKLHISEEILDKFSKIVQMSIEEVIDKINKVVKKLNT